MKFASSVFKKDIITKLITKLIAKKQRLDYPTDGTTGGPVSDIG